MIKQEVKIQQQHAPAAGGTGKGQAVTIAQEGLDARAAKPAQAEVARVGEESSAVSASSRSARSNFRR